MSCSTVILEGFLQKQCGGLFLKKKQKWAVLRADGTLSLSRKPELPASSVIHIYELDDVVYRDEDCSISFSSVYHGSIVKAYKFYALETPTFEDWTEALDKIRDQPSPEYADSRSRYVRHTLSAFQTTPQSGIAASSSASGSHVHCPVSLMCQDARVTITDEELEKQVDPILLIQSSGEPISKSGYIKKRGGAYGGNTSYKKRFFILTIFGRVVYFADHKKTQALGQFSLMNATIQHCKLQEISVVTPTRVWFLKFDSEATRLEWTDKLEAITNFSAAFSPPLAPSKSQSLTSPATSSLQEMVESGINKAPPPRFRRNMSLLIRQKSNVDGLGFSTLTGNSSDSDKKPNLTDLNADGLPAANTSVSVACITWNLSESLPKMQQCRFLRQYRKHQIVVVGVQECQSVMYHSFSARQLSPIDIWLAMVKSLMGDPFTLVASRSMGAIHVCVFVREDVIGSISDVNTTFVPCGLGNVMYNKGAVAVSLKCNQISFGFICAHLAANQDKTLDRNLDFHRISLMVIEQLGKVACVARKNSVILMEKNKTHRQAGLFIVMDDDDADEASAEDDPRTSTSTSNSAHTLHLSGKFQAVGGTGTLEDSLDSLAREFDRCFFMGDLNYRVDAGKEWIEHYLKMAEAMRQLEKEDLIRMKATSVQLTDLSLQGQGVVPKQEQDEKEEEEEEEESGAVLELEPTEEERLTEKNIEKMLNLIQVGDYGTDDDSDDESLTPSTTPTAAVASALGKGKAPVVGFPIPPPSNHSVDIMGAIDRVSLDNLRKERDVKRVVSTSRHVMTSDDHRALRTFKEDTKLTTSHAVFEFLLSYDQLCREMGKASVFRGFVEGPIQFKPSYKFDPFTETYDTSRKGRSAAWCDRVLYTPTHSTLDHYRCIHGKFHSDHRAVVAIFTVKLQ